MRAPLALLITIFLGCATARPVRPPFEWIAYGGDAGGTRYAPLDQINRANVSDLVVAWTYHTGESAADGRAWGKAAFEATPLFVDGLLFLSTPFNRVIALDPRNGAEKWRYDPKVDLSVDYSEVTSRGVATWLDPAAAAGLRCRRRIFIGTIDARLIALDSVTGQPCTDFGSRGTVDLTAGIERYRAGQYQVTSPPAIAGDLVIVGSSIGDNAAAELERGVVRAFDARTGALRWSWDPIPRKSGLKTGAANAWAPLSVDSEGDLVFVPTSSPSPDYYGGERLGDNAWANSIVALRASTGQPVWQFQTVHHDLWDYDIAAQPLLLDVNRDGRSIPAVAIGTKTGYVFLFDRVTGQPLVSTENRRVPESDVPGEAASPVQPVTAIDLVPRSLRPEDAWGLTDADREWCRGQIAKHRSEGTFTPPSIRGTIVFPGNIGGVQWGGMSFDPKRRLLIVPTNRLAFVVRLIPRDRFADDRRAAGDRVRGEFAPQHGTPFAMYREPLITPGFIPCNPPPWGTLTAIDTDSVAKKWEVPLGMSTELAQLPQAREWGSVHFGGALVTSGGLVFIAATREETLRAFDIETGEEVWSATLPASAQATPMSYSVDGRQYVVIAAGGHGKFGNKRGDAVVAFALKDGRGGRM